jgi:hypothetical protein
MASIVNQVLNRLYMAGEKNLRPIDRQKTEF